MGDLEYGAPGNLRRGDEGGLAEAVGDLSTHDECLTALARHGGIAKGLSAARSTCRLNPDRGGMADQFGRLSESMHGSGVTGLLSSLPLNPSALGGLASLTLVTASLRTIRRVFLEDTNDWSRIPRHLASFNASGLPDARLPPIDAAGFARLGGLSDSTEALRDGLDVNVFAQGAGERLRGEIDQLGRVGFFDSLRAFPMNTSVLQGLGSLSLLMVGLRSLTGGLGVNVLKRGGAKGLRTALRPDGELASLATRAASGSLGNHPRLRIPSPGRLLALNGFLGLMMASSSALRVDFRSPNAGKQLRLRLASLQKHGTCAAAKETTTDPEAINGLAQLGLLTTGLAAAQGLPLDPEPRIDLFQPGAADKLAGLVDGFRASGAEEAIQSQQVPEEATAGILRLGMLATAVDAQKKTFGDGST